MEEVTELQPVPDAHVPVMKFKFDGISIDLLYASISLLVVPEVSAEHLLMNLLEKTQVLWKWKCNTLFFLKLMCYFVDEMV